jgi:hypothetical protein
MLKITYMTFSPILNKHFTDYGFFKTESDYRLFMCSLFGGLWSTISVEKA